MFLQQVGFNLAQRLELLTTLYPAYWKWATSKILSGMVAKAQMLREATDRQRATIINQCWEAMVADQESQQVICRPAERKLATCAAASSQPCGKNDIDHAPQQAKIVIIIRANENESRKE